MDALEAMRTRRSVRVFDDRLVPKEKLQTIVDCARLAASARNEQPWEFVVVTDAETRWAIADATDFGKHIADAPACVAVLCRPTKYFLEDGSAATQNLLVAARAEGLASCWIAGDKKAYTATVLEIIGAPKDYKLISLVAVGFALDVPSPSKRPLREVLHWERF